MLTLFTGGPGAGKTAALVEMLLTIDATRPIFNDGLEGLKLPGRDVHPFDATNWPEEVPDGAIVVIDEAQRVWRPRGPASKVPAHVSEMETHRHRGLDFFVTTQAPRLIDANIRSLVGRHVHLRDVGWLGRHAYEWPECNESLGWKTCVNKRKYKLPVKAFAHYVSSSLHTKPIRTVPRAMIWGAFVVLVAVVLSFLAFRIFTGHVSKPDVSPASLAFAAAPAAASGSVRIDDRVDWVPRVSSRPESAPAFDHVRQVVVMPSIVGCAEFRGVARCYTQQGTDAGIPDAEARELLNRPRFDPYTLPVQQAGGTPLSAPKSSPAAF